MRIAVSILLSVVLGLAVGCGSTDQASGLQDRQEHRSASDWTGPDPDLTPGHLCDRGNSDFDEVRYEVGITHCRRNVETSDKIRVSARYGISDEERRGNYEIDHLIPLSIGGSNEDANLWPLWGPWARQKSEFEQVVQANVMSGEWSQDEAIRRLHAWRPEDSN